MGKKLKTNNADEMDVEITNPPPPDLIEQFQDYVAFGHFQPVNKLIKKGYDINCRDMHWNTALHAATGNYQLEMVKLLLKNGSNVNALGFFGRTPICNAIEDGDLEMVSVLIDNGAELNIRVDTSERNLLALAYFKSNDKSKVFEMIKLLIDKGADVNFTNGNGVTLLEMLLVGPACYSFHIDLIRLLMDRGAKIDEEYADNPLVKYIKTDAEPERKISVKFFVTETYAIKIFLEHVMGLNEYLSHNTDDEQIIEDCLELIRIDNILTYRIKEAFEKSKGNDYIVPMVYKDLDNFLFLLKEHLARIGETYSETSKEAVEYNKLVDVYNRLQPMFKSMEQI